jgi:hypothetical protein
MKKAAYLFHVFPSIDIRHGQSSSQWFQEFMYRKQPKAGVKVTFSLILLIYQIFH